MNKLSLLCVFSLLINTSNYTIETLGTSVKKYELEDLYAEKRFKTLKVYAQITAIALGIGFGASLLPHQQPPQDFSWQKLQSIHQSKCMGLAILMSSVIYIPSLIFNVQKIFNLSTKITTVENQIKNNLHKC